MTGEEAVREIRKRGSRVFVCGATGNALKGALWVFFLFVPLAACESVAYQ